MDWQLAKKVIGRQRGHRSQTAAPKSVQRAVVSGTAAGRAAEPLGQRSRAVHWPRTLMQKGDQPLSAKHLRYQFRQAAAHRLCCLLLDCSASMLRQRKLSLAKGLIVELAWQIRRERGQLAVIGFHGDQARILNQPDQLSGMNEHWIRGIQGGGGTPLRRGIAAAEHYLRRCQRHFPGISADCWLLTDGRFLELPAAPKGARHCTVIDFEEGGLRLAKAGQLAQRWNATYLRADMVLAVDELFGPTGSEQD